MDSEKFTVLPDITIITGMSGAGRTEAMHVFEDLGYFCVDNLPSALISSLIDLKENSKAEDSSIKKVAVVCDARNGEFFGDLAHQIEKLKDKSDNICVIFLDSDNARLVARYKSSRRRHPLCGDGTTITEGITRERTLMQPIKDLSDICINTTDMLPQELRSTIREIFESKSDAKGLSVSVYSFGFKHEPPLDADIVMDVRFLPNPYYLEDLKPLTGLDAPVRDFVMLRDETIDFMKKWKGLLDVVMPGYVKEGKQMLAIGIGCTGGQHRSVAIAEATGNYLKQQGYRVSIAHRDLDKRNL